MRAALSAALCLLLAATAQELSAPGEPKAPELPTIHHWIDEHPLNRNQLRGNPIVLDSSDAVRGSVCPVSPWLAYSARHVLAPEGKMMPNPIRLGIMTEDSTPFFLDAALDKDFGEAADLVRLRLLGAEPFPQHYTRAKSYPRAGEPLQTIFVLPGNFIGRQGPAYGVDHGYYFGRQTDDLAKGEEILYTLSQISFGASGGCVLNESGEVVGVIVKIRGFGDQIGFRASGFRALLKGMWK